MSLETIYFKTEQNLQYEQNMAQNPAYIGCFVADERRVFLTTLAEAVGRSEAIITIGQLPLLASVLSRGLGSELADVDWNALGLEPQEGVLLPKGALPLVVDSKVAGMILENSGQCIISINSDPEDIDKLCDLYVLPYIDALQSASRQESPADNTAQEEPQVDEQPAAEQQNAEAEETQQEEVPENIGNVDKIDIQAPINTPESIHKIMQEKAADIFADMDMTDEEIDKIVPPRNFHGLRNFIIFIIVTALLVCGGIYGYNNYIAPNQYDDSYNKAITAYTENQPDSEAFSSKHFNYSADFTSLYKINNNVIGWLEVEGLNLSAPVVSSANRSEGYYDQHIFDKTYNPYGTLYVDGIYDKSNLHVNFVINGKSHDDTRLFSSLSKYLDSSFALENHTFKTRTVFDEKETDWEIFAVLQFSDKNSNYLNNFTSLSAAQRQSVVASALEESKVNFGVDTVSYLNDMGTYKYTTLVTEYNGQYLAVMARNIVESGNGEVTDQPTS